MKKPYIFICLFICIAFMTHAQKNLEVEGDAEVTGTIKTTNTAGNNGLNLSENDNYAELRVIRNTLNPIDSDLYFNFAAPAGSKLHLYSNGAETMTLNNNLVGISKTVPTEKLDVNGAIRIGNTTNSNDGTIRFNGTDLQGHVGGAWTSLTSGGTSSSLWTQTGSDIGYGPGNVGIHAVYTNIDFNVRHDPSNALILRVEDNSGTKPYFQIDQTGIIGVNHSYASVGLNLRNLTAGNIPFRVESETGAKYLEVQANGLTVMDKSSLTNGVAQVNGQAQIIGQSIVTGVAGINQLYNDVPLTVKALAANANAVRIEDVGGLPKFVITEDGKVGINRNAASNLTLSIKGHSSTEPIMYVEDVSANQLLVMDQNGNTAFTGNIAKGGGSFKIDHPLDPENKYLYHSFVESPDMMNVYNGNITTDSKGEATVSLPDYFEALNKDFRYQLTAVGTFAQLIIKEKLQNNTFVIASSVPNVEVSWQITGIRQDAFANKNRIPNVVKKKGLEKGFYLHAKAFNQPESKQFKLNAAREKQEKLSEK